MNSSFPYHAFGVKEYHYHATAYKDSAIFLKLKSNTFVNRKSRHQSMLVINVCAQRANPIRAKNMILVIFHKHYFLHHTSYSLHRLLPH